MTATVPVKYANLHNVTPEYEATGKAAVRFKLVSLRAESYVFKLFEEDWQEGDGKHWAWKTDENLRGAVAVATSEEVRFRDAMAPAKVRVLPVNPQYGGGAPLARVMWSSGRRPGGAPAAPTLAWGTTRGGPYPNLVSASTSYISYEDLCDGPANSIGYLDLGLIHDAVLAGAAHGSRVFYRVGDEASTTPEFELKMPPAAGEPVSLAVFADMGHAIEDDSLSWDNYGAPSKYVMREVNRLVDRDEIDAVFHVGDTSYAEGFLSVWDEYLSQIESFASRRMYMLNFGNHEQVRSAADGPARPGPHVPL